MPKALITGISGQDGSYLAEYLLKKGYQVHGIVRRVALENPTQRLWRLKKIINICRKNRYINHNPFDGFSINFKRSNRVFLSTEELKSLTDVMLRKSLSKIK